MTSRKEELRKKGRAPALAFTDATKLHGEVRAVGPVSLTIEAGQRVALMGHNGSGKSTLLSIAAGLTKPTEGTARVFGTSAGEQAARAAVSYIRDQPVLYEDLSVWEHLEYLSRLHGSDPATHDAERLIDRLGLSGRIDDLPSTFSRGLRQKTAIAIALCRPLAVLLVDEPFAGLDHAGQVALLEIFTETADQNAAILVATHDRRVLEDFDRALVLDEGEVVYDGAAADVPADLVPADSQGTEA